MQSDPEESLSDEATFVGRPRPQRADVSLGDERTVGDEMSGQDTLIDDINGNDFETRYRTGVALIPALWSRPFSRCYCGFPKKTPDGS